MALAAPSPAPAASPGTLLTVEVQRSATAPRLRYSLACQGGAIVTDSFQGSLRACVLLARARSPFGGPDPFAPVPASRMCSQLYGGPQVARVRGTFRGRRVDAVFTRVDGCQTARWNAVAFLFPPLARLR